MWKFRRTDEAVLFSKQRTQMVKLQIVSRGVRDERVLDAMRHVPRHLFVPQARQSDAYDDHPIPIGNGQTISQPYMVALMTELAGAGEADRVLEVGTGSGYQAAILAELAAEVITIERHVELADSARTRLEGLGYDNVTVVAGDGTLGCPEHAPYDVIIVTAGGPHVPEALKSQLAIDGRLVCPVGARDMQRLVVLQRTPGEFIETGGVGCIFVPLVGEEGWT
ncbi:MAG: protein-L-isoaspartate(D-aspartate) O-methyltransferase [Nitrospiraceae bacterium]|nr:protein-L-isoaspartate(D-aspartate) O-methyltransferase [Nitrospiraceae bacterium]